MKKIIILIAILCGFSFSSKIDESKVLNRLGGNCKFDAGLSDDDKVYFDCDSSSINFDFTKDEIAIIITDEEGTYFIFFNRGWNKKNKQIHKEKSVVILHSDEFKVIVAEVEFKWLGNIYDFYDKFKEKVYYGKQNNKLENEEPITVEESVYESENEVEDTEPKDTYTEYRIAQIMGKYK